MKFGYKLGHASGDTIHDCWFLGYRYDADYGFRWDEMESRAIKSQPDAVHSRIRQPSLMTGLWRARSGTAWVSHLGGDVHVLGPDRLADGSPGARHTLPAALGGVWGLSEELVFAWGEFGLEPRMYVWDGKAWRPTEVPGPVHAVHGADSSSIVAVGPKGMIAQWSGSGFRQIGCSVSSPLSDVHVVDAGEIYVVGASGRILEGSAHGFSEVTRVEHALGGVTKFADRVFVAAGPEGLMTLEHDRLEVVRADIAADRFDSRGSLVISTVDAIVESDDGERFRARDVEVLVGVIGAQAPLWLDHPV